MDEVTVKEIVRKRYRLIGFGIDYVNGVTNDNEIIRGGSLFLFGKQSLTIALSKTEWVDDNGKPYKFKVDGTVLFVKRVAIGIGKRGL